MAEKDIVFSGKIKQKAIFNFKDFYNYTYDWFMTEGYKVTEKLYSEEISGDAKKIEIEWDIKRKISDYFRFVIKVNWMILGLKNVEVPKEFLRAEEVIDIPDLEFYLTTIDNEELRNQATRLFAKDLDTAKIKSALREDPLTAKKILKLYLESLEKMDLKSYDFKFDSELIYKFPLYVEQLKKHLPKKETLTKDKPSLKQFVEEVIAQYKKVIEKRENYWLLYNDNDTPKAEVASQRLFWAIADTMCSLNGEVVVNRENPTGRGPVDFKFSKGYNNKIVLEIKQVKSTQIFHGLESQLVTYINSEESDYGYYLVIKLTPNDTARFHRLNMRYDKLNAEIKDKIIITEIDARTDNKKSASKS